MVWGCSLLGLYSRVRTRSYKGHFKGKSDKLLNSFIHFFTVSMYFLVIGDSVLNLQMTLKRKNNHSTEFDVFKLVENEILHKILGLFCQKLKIQDGRRKPWVYANNHIKEGKIVLRDRCVIMWPMQWSCDAKHGIPANSPPSTLRQT